VHIKIIEITKQIFESKTSIYLANKYITYVIQFAIVILCAKLLGIKYFAIYSFIKLLGQYHSYTNLGVNFSFNVIASTLKESNKNNLNNLFNNTLFLNFGFIVVTILMTIFLFSLDINLLSKYSLKDYIVPTILYLTFKQLNVLFVTYSRLINNLRFINIFYLLPVLFELISLLIFFKIHNTLLYIIWSMVLSHFLIFVLFLHQYYSNFKITSINFPSLKNIFIKGIMLLIYNFTFYFLLIGAKSFVSKFGSIDAFSNFSLSSNLVEAVGFAISAITFLIFPKILNKYNSKSKANTLSFINNNGDLYALCLTSLFFCLLLLYPVIEILFVKFTNLSSIIIGLSVSSFLLLNTFLYSSFLIQKKQEIYLIKIGIFSISILFLSCFLGLKLNFDLIKTTVISLIICNLLYNFLMISMTFKLLNTPENIYIKSLKNTIAIQFTFPLYIYIISLVLDIKLSLILLLFVLLIFVLINRNAYLKIYNKLIQIFTDDNFLSIKGLK
jgi:O-antigen/teichoic acid export membrane protein